MSKRYIFLRQLMRAWGVEGGAGGPKVALVTSPGVIDVAICIIILYDAIFNNSSC
jgi:hypothetical protein